MDVTWVRKLAAVGVQAASADNSQPWRLRWDGRELAIFYGETPSSAFSADSHATLLSVGAVVENLQWALTANTVTADWQWPSNPALGQPYVSIPLHETAANFIAPEGPLHRHTNRHPYRRDALAQEIGAAIENHREGKNRSVLLLDAKKKSRLNRLVRLCSEARFCNQELHEWLIDSLRFTPDEVARGDGLDVRTLALPPGGKMLLHLISDWRRLKALNVIGAYKLLAFSEVKLLNAAPALICIVGSSDTRSTIDAGRLMTRLWIYLNLNGVAVQPYYVVPDQINRLRQGRLAKGFESQIAAVEAELRVLLELQSGEVLHLMFRVGYPKKETVRSKRLPLDALFSDNPPLRAP
jgi:hypothetical protein